MASKYPLVLSAGGELDMEATIQSCMKIFGKGHDHWAGWLPQIERAAREDYDWEDGPSQGPLFRLARVLKGRVMAEGRDLGASSFLHLVHVFYHLFTEVHDGSEPWSFSSRDTIDWEDDQEVAEAWEILWDKIRFGEEEDVVSRAHRMSLSRNVRIPEALSKKAGMVLRLAYEFHLADPLRPFIFPQERVAKALGISQPNVSLALMTLRKKGYLKIFTDHNRLDRKATEYLCLWVPKKTARSKLK